MTDSNLNPSYVGALGSGNPVSMMGVVSGGTGPADASLTFSTSNLERMRINSVGNVAIGKSNASYALDVVGEINASSNIRIAGQSLLGLGVPTQVVLTSGSSTWAVPSGVTGIQVEMVGAGGGGSCGANSSAGSQSSGAGGGAGGYIKTIISVTSGSSISYTVGTGGAGSSTASTSGGTGNSTTITYNSNTATANGGSGGTQNANNYPGLGGSGGTVSSPFTNSVTSIGGSGTLGTQSATNVNIIGGGTGGSSYFGGGGYGAGYNASATLVASQAGQAYGSGGGSGGSTLNTAGSAGAPGVIILTYFSASGLPTNYTVSAPLSLSGTNLSWNAPRTVAYVKFVPNSGTTTQTITKQFNVSSVYRNSAGDYTLTFTNALDSADYIVSGSLGNNAQSWNTTIVPNGGSSGTYTPTTTTFRFSCFATSTWYDPTVVYIILTL